MPTGKRNRKSHQIGIYIPHEWKAAFEAWGRVRGVGYQTFMKEVLGEWLEGAGLSPPTEGVGSGLDKLVRVTHDAYPVGPVVYFIQAGEGGFIKVGWSANVKMRMAGLQTGRPEELHLLLAFTGTRVEEGRLHARLAPYRVRGEWFKPDPAVLKSIEVLRSWAIKEGLCHGLGRTGTYRAGA